MIAGVLAKNSQKGFATAVGRSLNPYKPCGQSSRSRRLFARFSAKRGPALEAQEPDPAGTMPPASQWIFRCEFHTASRAQVPPELVLRSALSPA
jgi:hypothetical protein